MIEGVLSFPSKLQPSLLSDLEGFGEVYVKVVDTARPERVAAYRGSIRQSDPLHPMNVSRSDAQTSIGITVSGCAELRAGSWSQDRAAVQGRVRIADVSTVIGKAVVVSVESVRNAERGAGLKRSDACN